MPGWHGVPVHAVNILIIHEEIRKLNRKKALENQG